MNTDQIVAEVARAIADTLGLKNIQVAGLRLIIRSGIEKARSEPWTYESVYTLFHENHPNGFQAIADAHNGKTRKEIEFYDQDHHLNPTLPKKVFLE